MTSISLAILSNAMSTQNRADGPWLADIVADHPKVRRFTIDSVEDIPRILSECAANGIETLTVDGGDGTAGLVFSGLLNDGPYPEPPALALLPSGKTNMTARAWSLKGNRRSALKQLLHRAAEGTLDRFSFSQAILAVLEDPNQPPRHGAFFGGADVVEGIFYCRRAIYPLGLPNVISHAAAVAVLFGRAVSTKPLGDMVSVRFDDSEETEEGQRFVVLATTMDRMLLGLKPKPTEGTGPVYYISLKSGPGAVLSAVPNLISRRITPGQARTVRRAGKIIVSHTGRYTLDGEMHDMHEDRPLVLSGHQSLRFIRW